MGHSMDTPRDASQRPGRFWSHITVQCTSLIRQTRIWWAYYKAGADWGGGGEWGACHKKKWTPWNGSPLSNYFREVLKYLDPLWNNWTPMGYNYFEVFRLPVQILQSSIKYWTPSALSNNSRNLLVYLDLLEVWNIMKLKLWHETTMILQGTAM